MSNTFKNEVELKYYIYNSLFLKLPFDNTYQTGIHLPILQKLCVEYYNKQYSPHKIIEDFLDEYYKDLNLEDRETILFNFIKYVERQVVLFDSLEDAAFSKVNDLSGIGTIANLLNKIVDSEKIAKFAEVINSYNVRLVLTAHPTQFYPGSILSIINKLNNSIGNNDIEEIQELLVQLSKTPFFSKEKPTPFDEAKSLIWYLENVFYDSVCDICFRIKNFLETNGFEFTNYKLITMGFWPGGDRDGNHFVDSKITKKVLLELKKSILGLYLRDISFIKSKLTFRHTEELIQNIEEKLYRATILNEETYFSFKEIIIDLENVKNSLTSHHSSIFIDYIDNFLFKVKIFEFTFAELDIRQDKSIFDSVLEKICDKFFNINYSDYQDWHEDKKIEYLLKQKIYLQSADFEEDVEKDLIETFYNIKWIQEYNSEKAASRYIMSNCHNASDVIFIYQLAKWTAWKDDFVTFDIIPLFESIDDLERADQIMQDLYSNNQYREHIKSRNNGQTIMLGFSDGTKDGGYLSANWSIYTAKENLTRISREFGIKISFFDGRGGPPSRGGGNTHKFFASMGDNIENNEIQITVQGQTISSNFGTPVSATYNIEQLLSAGVENKIFQTKNRNPSDSQRKLISELSKISLDSYSKLKARPDFLSYLQNLGTLDYYGLTNIGSRPTKRKSSNQLSLSSLRAIPFVGTWSQLKQNVPGFYGLGSALELFDKDNRLLEVQDLYKSSLFFRTLINNSMQSLCKTYFPLTYHFANHPEFSDIWNDIHNEYKKTIHFILLISEQKELMEDSPTIKSSISLREEIMLPLLTIQQFALGILREDVNLNESKKNTYKKMVIRTMFGIINATRNSA